MKDKSFWIQLIVSALIPLVLGSSTVFVFSLFEERLPDWAYNTLVSIFYVFFVIFLAVFAVILIRLAFGEWLTRFNRWRANCTLHKKRLSIVEEWHDSWIRLGKLLLDVIDKSYETTDEQRKEYIGLRDWFIRNRSKFLPIYHWFSMRRTLAAHESLGSSGSLLHKVFYENHDDPFSYFYLPPALEAFEDILRYHEEDMPHVLLRLKERLDELTEWIKLQ